MKNIYTMLRHVVKLSIVLSIVVFLFLTSTGFTSPVFASAHVTRNQPKIVALSRIVIVGSSPSHIHQAPHKILGLTLDSSKIPNITPNDPCLYNTAATYSPASNQVDALGETTNDCLATVNGNQYVTIANGCPGPGPGGSAEYGFHLAVDTSFDKTTYIDAGCVVCEDGKPIAYPDFTIVVNVSANGSFTYRGKPYNATSSNIGTSSVEVVNDGYFAPRCP